jgi:hypothetical protein
MKLLVVLFDPWDIDEIFNEDDSQFLTSEDEDEKSDELDWRNE